MQSPVLFLIFNRPNYAEKSLAAIRKAKPAKLYVAADGPRTNKKGEKELCRQTRDLVLNFIDWECEVKTLFQNENLGCALGVNTGISWFFEHEEQGIILEDDIVANLNFFKFCDELLQKYKHDKNIWTIAGFNWQGVSSFKESYSFVKCFCCWGWATWKDRWKHFSLDIKKLREDIFDSYTKNEQVKNHLANYLWLLHNDSESRFVTWALPYYFTGISHGALHIVPQKRMTKNIGYFGQIYTHKKHPFLNLKTYKLDITRHPKCIKNNRKLQDELDILSSPFPKYPKIPKIKNRKIYLWGIGAFAKTVLFLTRKYKIAAFLDKQQTEEYCGYKIKLPEQILSGKNRDFFIFIASTKYAEDMAKVCERYGLKKGVDFWKPC